MQERECKMNLLPSGIHILELMIVIVVIVAFVGVSVPFYQDNLSDSIRTKARQDADVIKSALNLYNLQHGTLVQPKGGIGNIDKGTLVALKEAGYLQEVPSDGSLQNIKMYLGGDNGDSFLVSTGLDVRMASVKSMVKAVKDHAQVALTARRTYSLAPERDEETRKAVEPSRDLFREDMTREDFFDSFKVNPFFHTSTNPLSTFSIDVDTASFSIAKNALAMGYLPQSQQVRMEEFVNYFRYDYAPPAEDVFAVRVQGAPSLFHSGYHLLAIGVKAREQIEEERKPLALTFVIDCSGSMDSDDRLGLVKRSVKCFVNSLKPDDMIAIVSYSGEAKVEIGLTPVSEKRRILNALDATSIGGSTFTESGLKLGYRIASDGFSKERVNRVIHCSDGGANIGGTDGARLIKSVVKEAEKGIYLTCLGYGTGSYKDSFMEELADKGNGVYSFINDMDEAERVLVDGLGGGFEVVAKDAKIQVEFNKDAVEQYRLIGYENRKMRDDQFRNDTVDAGEVGLGHSVTAVYEVKFTNDAEEPQTSISSEDLGVVRVRYGDPKTDTVSEVACPLKRSSVKTTIAEVAPDTCLAICAANFAEMLRGSYFAGGNDITVLIKVFEPLAEKCSDARGAAEFVSMMNEAQKLVNGKNRLIASNVKTRQ
jgi:Ca-activated chloride channel family protein